MTLVVGWLGAASFAEDGAAKRSLSVAEQIRAGNAAYAAGDYEQALQAYPHADAVPEAERALVLHNRASALFQLGRLDDARELWVRAAPLASKRLEARMQYNLGNCDYREVIKQLEAAGLDGMVSGDGNATGAGGAPTGEPPPLDALVASLDRAVAQYRDALKLDRGLVDARANLELAVRLKQRLEELAEEQEQQQEQQSSEEQEQQSSEEQEQENDQNNQSDQNNDQQPDGEQGDEQDQQSQDQQSEREDEQESEQQDSQQPEPNEQESDGEEEQQQPPPQTQPAQTQPVAQTQAMLNLTREQAERLLQMLLDAEAQRREALRQRQAAERQPVEKDW